MFIQYTVVPDRFVASGPGEIQHDMDDTYKADTVVKGDSVESRSREAVQTSVDSIKREHNVRTTPIPISEFNKWREFQESTLGTEVFTFDAYGTSGTPDNPVQVYMAWQSYQYEKLGEMFFIASFRLIEA